jgi:hypothetical protein
MLISFEGTGKNQLQSSQENMRDAASLSRYSLLRYPSRNATGVLELCHEGETTSWFSVFHGVSF